MKNSATKSRIGASTAKALIFAALVSPLGIAPAPALADGIGIQMLPPVTEDTKLNGDPNHSGSVPTTCSLATTGGSGPFPIKKGETDFLVPNILTWDGVNPITCATGMMVKGGYVGIGTTSPAAALDVYGEIAADGSTTITSPPPMVGDKGGWKIGLWGDTYALGIAEFTFAMETGRWFSLFPGKTYPANNATTTTPDTNATIDFDAVHGNGLFSGGVGIGTTTPKSSLDLSQRTDAISMPSGTTAQEPASPTPGMTRYNTDDNKLEYYNGTSWALFAAAGTPCSSIPSGGFGGPIVPHSAWINGQGCGGTAMATPIPDGYIFSVIMQCDTNGVAAANYQCQNGASILY